MGSETSTLGLKFSAPSTCGIPLPLSKYGEEVISSLFLRFGSSLIEHYSLKWGFKHRGRKHRGPLPQGPKYELEILNCELRSKMQFNFKLRIANCQKRSKNPIAPKYFGTEFRRGLRWMLSLLLFMFWYGLIFVRTDLYCFYMLCLCFCFYLTWLTSIITFMSSTWGRGYHGIVPLLFSVKKKRRPRCINMFISRKKLY